MSTLEVTKNEFAREGAEQALKAAIVQTMIRVRTEAVQSAPSDLGQLRNSIMWRKGWTTDAFGFPQEGGFNEAGPGKNGSEQATQKITSPSGLEGFVGSAVEYATYQEFGTRRQKAQPYMRPAADAVRGFDASQIANTWGREAMAKEFRKRRTSRGL